MVKLNYSYTLEAKINESLQLGAIRFSLDEFILFVACLQLYVYIVWIKL